ncbi:MAG: glycosyltransferase family 39 protein [candidate division WOR-3 bacterium]|nr:glycosyltransferase family 39 protein [candidate division WOR-3 bacterium]
MWFLAILIAFLPRFFRLIYPYAWFEDSAYLYHAFAFKSGLKPFIHTLCVHPPTIEYLLALLYEIFGVSYLVAEIFTGLVVSITVLFLFDIVRRIFNKYIALLVITIFSFSSLLFRYHIFEREIFTLFLSVLILWFVANKRLTSFYAAALGGLAGIGFGIKFSGLIILLSLAGYFLFQRNLRAIIFILIGFALITAFTWGYFLIKFKEPAFHQLLTFHFFKGIGVSFKTRFFEIFVRDLNYIWLLGGSGIILYAIKSEKFFIFPLLLFSGYVLFFLFISTTCWPHNMIDLLLPLSLGNGFSLTYLYKFLKFSRKNLLPVILIGVMFLIFASIIKPSYYTGFGYIPRYEVRKVASFIKENTPDRFPIHAPHYIANEAQRFKVVDYEELIGPYYLLMDILKNPNDVEKKKLLSSTWYELVEKTLPLWRYDLNEMIIQRKISCAVWDSISVEWSLMYVIDKYYEEKSGLFSRNGYKVKYSSQFYKVWLVN